MEKNKGKIIFCLILFGILVVGGFVLTKITAPKDDSAYKKDNSNEITKDIRKDKDQEYIYFSDPDFIDDELDIFYTDVVINFKDTNSVAATLNEESKNFKAELKYGETKADEDDSDKEEDEEKDKDKEEANVKAYNNLIYAHYKRYDVYNYGHYVSLVANYYTYTPDTLVVYESSKAYVFDKNNGKLLSSKDLLKEYNLTESDVINKIKTYVNDQNLIKEDEKLDAVVTSQNADLNAMYIDKLGHLVISVLVKSSLNDYNDVITLN